MIYKIKNRLTKYYNRHRAYIFGSEVSDSSFRNALDRYSTPNIWQYSRSSHDTKCFFLSSSRHKEFTSAILENQPEISHRIIQAADQVVSHRFDLLGSGLTDFGPRINWHVDFKSNHFFDPQVYCLDHRPAAFPGGFDIKVPWELSRCQHFAWLGQAYWFTADEKYAKAYVAQIEDWIQANPNEFGVNWGCTMDVAIRAINWLWGYFYFEDSPMLSQSFRRNMSKSLLAHGRHILKYLEWSPTFTHNHYLSNIVGLVYLGILLPEFKEAQQWRRFGLQEIEREIFKQVYDDGVNFEASTSYHRLATEMFLSATVLAQMNGYFFSEKYMHRLENMLEFIMAVTKPDGTVPLIGDNDNGRLHRLQVCQPPVREWNDYRYLLAIGAVLFNRNDLALAAGDSWIEAIWFYGKKALDFKHSANQIPTDTPHKSQGFPCTGWYVMKADDAYMFISAGSNGQNGNGGHAHNDKLSFELFVNGTSWFVDPGTFAYTDNYHERNRYRSTAMHNTVTVNKQEQAPIASTSRHIFHLADTARPIIKEWATTEKYDLFVGEHKGFLLPNSPVVHRRVIFFDKALVVWLIHDFLLNRRQEEAITHFHLAPQLRWQPTSSGNGMSLSRHGRNVALCIEVLGGEISSQRAEPGYSAIGYGMRVPTTLLEWEWAPEIQDVLIGVTPGSSTVTTSEKYVAAFRHYQEIYAKVHIDS